MTPHIYAGATVTAVVSNVVLLVTAFHLADADGKAAVGSAWSFTVLGTCAAVEALGFFLLWLNMVPEFRRTLWQRRTTRQHVELALWEAGTYTGRYGRSLNDSKAQILSSFCVRYWPPKDIVAAWVRKNWDTWKDEASRPKWFNKRFRRMFPAGYLPENLDMKSSSKSSRSSWIGRAAAGGRKK